MIRYLCDDMACTTFVDGHGRCMMFGVLELSGLCVFGIETETYACGCICLTACLICSEVMSCLCLLVAVTRRGLRSPDV